MLDCLAELGIPFVPCSGRAFNVLPKEVVNHPASKYVVSCDGAIIRDLSTQTVLHEPLLLQGAGTWVVSKLKDYPVTLTSFADGGVYLDAQGIILSLSWVFRRSCGIYTTFSYPFDQSVEEFIDSVTTIERLGSYWSVAEGEIPGA